MQKPQPLIWLARIFTSSSTRPARRSRTRPCPLPPRETSTRLNLVAAWREATVFTEAERAALELTEQGTRIADAAGGVRDEAWANAAEHYDEEQLAALVSLIAVINTYNRLNVIIRQPAGDYQPGMFG
ncbi:carboxymuconolactone decarboxylase family protein [Kitasatospora acidiphila]|uniref:carboxymuconolactone decarboxylase family protein n=1 Tax=Kitasatospora acidiphila TaxID=2567942 RepID=UPI003C72279A